MRKTKEQVKNCLTSDLRNMIYEAQDKNFDEAIIFDFFSEILLDADVESEIIVDVLESVEFGELGKCKARNIKVNEGW